MNIIRAGFGLLLTTAAACSAGAPSAETAGPLQVTVDTLESGTILVHSRGEAPEWSLQEALTIESTPPDVSSTPTFVEATSVAVDRTDAVWVADSGSGQIRVFGRGGNLIRMIGSRGEGPGQFLTLESLAFVGRSVIALDSGNQRISAFSLSGAWRGDRPAPFAGADLSERHRLYPVSPSEVYEWTVRDGDDGRERLWIGHAEQRIASTRPAIPDPPDAPSAVVRCVATSENDARTFRVPYQPRQVEYPASQGGRVVAWTGEYRVVFLDAEGDTARIVEREREAAPATETDWDMALAPYRAFRTEHPDASCDPPELRRPETAPPIHDIMIDVAGRLLVEANATQGRVWDVYDLGGYPLGTFPSFERDPEVAPYFTTEAAVWVTKDTSGAQRVELARIAR